MKTTSQKYKEVYSMFAKHCKLLSIVNKKALIELMIEYMERPFVDKYDNFINKSDTIQSKELIIEDKSDSKENNNNPSWKERKRKFDLNNDNK